MDADWGAIRAYLAGRQDEEDEADEEDPEDEGDEGDEEDAKDAKDEGDEGDEGDEEDRADHPGPYRAALAAAGDALPGTAAALALSNPAVTVARWLDGLHARAERPGSVMPLVFVLLVFIFALVPVNGDATRLELIWRALTGGAALPPSATELALAAQYQDLAAERQTESTIAAGVWGGMWGVAGTLIP
jgi:hypothetical protein